MADEQDHDAEALAALFAAMRLFLRRTANSIQGTEVSEGDVANAVAIALSQALVDDLFIAAYIDSIEEPFYRAVLAAAQRQASALGISPDVVFDGDLLADAQRQIVRSGRFVLDTIRGDINDIIEAAVAEGLNADETMQRIAAKVSEQQRAMRIARTERGMAINTGNYAAATEAWRRGIVVGKRWNAILDDRVRDSHYLIHGETVRFDSLFSNGGSRPLDPSLPANEVINCFPDGTEISASHATHSMVTHGSFILNRLTTALGDDITATPNHKVLTLRGWVAMKDIVEGDYLLGASELDTPARLRPDDNDVVPVVEQFRELAQAGGILLGLPHRIGSHLNLDESAVDYEVNAVPLDRPFSLGRYAEKLEKFGEFGIASTEGEMGISGDCTSLSSILESDPISLTAGSAVDTVTVENGGAATSRESRLSLNGQQRLLSSESLKDVRRGDIQTPGLVGPGAKTRSMKGTSDGFDIDSELAHHLQLSDTLDVQKLNDVVPVLVRRSGVSSACRLLLWNHDGDTSKVGELEGDVKMTLHKVVANVGGIEYVGHVHDVTTNSALFGVGSRGFIVHNCRCALSYVRYTDEAASSLLAAGGTFEGERWRGTLAIMDTPTADGRILIGTPTWRLLPLPLFFQPEQADAHSGAVQVGVIESIEVLDGNIIGEGYLFLNHPMYEAALTVIASRSGQLSIDPSEAEVVEMLDGSTGYLNPVLSGVTITAGPAAFDDTRIYLTASGLEIVDESVMVAAGLPKFKASAFVPRVFTKRTPLTVDGDMVYGHAAAWGTCHRGFAGTCRIVPRSKKNYSTYHLRRVGLDDGSFINVGALTAGSGHAPTSGVTNAQVTEHYDNVASVWAFVRCYEDRFGVAFVGQLLPDVDEAFLLRAVGPLSGDWRKVDGNLELHALLSVPVPGFAVEESLVAAALPDEGDDDVLIADLGSVECEPCVTSALASLRLRLLRDKFGIKPLAAQPDYSDGIMIALMPEGGVSWSQIDPAHITIVYGGSVNDADAPDKTAMLASAAAIAARFSPVELMPIGVAQFGDEAVVATFNDGMLDEMRDVVEVFNRSQYLDFRPHLTISYGGELVDVGSLTPVRFDRIELHYGDEVAAFPLS